MCPEPRGAGRDVAESVASNLARLGPLEQQQVIGELACARASVYGGYSRLVSMLKSEARREATALGKLLWSHVAIATSAAAA